MQRRAVKNEAIVTTYTGGDKEPSRTRPDHRRRGTLLHLKVAVTHKEEDRWGRTRIRRCEEGSSPEVWKV